MPSMVYGVGQSIARGSPARTDDTRYGVCSYQFASEQSCCLAKGRGAERALQFPNVIAAIPVAGAATIGDASATLAITTERSGAGTARGYLIEAQVGAQTAHVQLLGIPDVPLAAVEELAGLKLPASRLAHVPTGRRRQVCRSLQRRPSLTRTRRTLEHAAILLPD